MTRIAREGIARKGAGPRPVLPDKEERATQGIGGWGGSILDTADTGSTGDSEDLLTAPRCGRLRGVNFHKQLRL